MLLLYSDGIPFSCTSCSTAASRSNLSAQDSSLPLLGIHLVQLPGGSHQNNSNAVKLAVEVTDLSSVCQDCKPLGLPSTSGFLAASGRSAGGPWPSGFWWRPAGSQAACGKVRPATGLLQPDGRWQPARRPGGRAGDSQLGYHFG